MRRRPGHHRQGQRGQALAEFAIVATVFILLILGLFEVGFAVRNYNTLSEATREGSRYAIVHGADSWDPSGPGTAHYTALNFDEKVTEVVESFGAGLDSSRLTVESEWVDGTNQSGSRVKITSRYTYEPYLNFMGMISFEMGSSSTMVITN